MDDVHKVIAADVVAANDNAVDDTIYADDAAVAADDAADKATAIAETAVNMVL